MGGADPPVPQQRAPAAALRGCSGRWCLKRIHQAARTCSTVVRRWIHGSSGRRASVAIPLDPPATSTSALGNWLRRPRWPRWPQAALRFARLVRAWHIPVRDPVRLQQTEAVRRRLGIRGDVRLLLSPAAAIPMTGGSVAACSLASRIGGRVVPRAVEDRA